MKNIVFAMIATVALTALAGPAAAQSTGYDGMSFVQAVRNSDGDKAQELLRAHPVDGIVNTRGGDGQTSLILAIARSDDQWTVFLLNKHADPDLPGRGGDTPLINAARVGYENGVEWLLEVGAKVDLTNRSGETPLIVAVEQRQTRIVQMLLEAGADPDKTDHAAGYSAREYAQRDPRARDILKLIDAKKPKAAAAAAAK